MKERRKLDSWKEISCYLSRTVRTVQRWERECGLPVRRFPGSPKGRVYAFSDDIDAWLNSERTPKEARQDDWLAKPENNSIQIIQDPQKKKNRQRLKWNIAGITLLALASIFIFLFMFPEQENDGKIKIGKLDYEIIYHEKNTQIIFSDSTGNNVLTINASLKYFRDIKNIQGRGGSDLLFVGDVNGDSLEDIILINPNGLEQLDFHIREKNGGFKHKIWDMRFSFEYRNTTYSSFVFSDLKVFDVNGDNTPEILVCQKHRHLFPSCFRVFDMEQKIILKMLHPGSLRSAWVLERNNDGVKEVYLAGTNNFITKYSAPICLILECDWHKNDQELLFFGNKGAMPATVPKGIKVVYINLKKDDVNPNASIWETAAVMPSSAHRDDDFICVFASPYTDPTKNDDTSLHTLYARGFLFDKNLACSYSYIIPNDEKYYRNASSSQIKDLLTPVYWNGASWQEEVCTIPQGPSSNAHQ